MKVSGIEKCILALTAAFLLFFVGYFWGGRSTGEPYTVHTQTQWTQSVAQTGQTAQPPTEHAPVNINTATVGQLQELPGIGQERAAAIVADREANGPFRIPEDITRVPGIGQGTLEEMLNYITVD